MGRFRLTGLFALSAVLLLCMAQVDAKKKKNKAQTAIQAAPFDGGSVDPVERFEGPLEEPVEAQWKLVWTSFASARSTCEALASQFHLSKGRSVDEAAIAAAHESLQKVRSADEELLEQMKGCESKGLRHYFVGEEAAKVGRECARMDAELGLMDRVEALPKAIETRWDALVASSGVNARELAAFCATERKYARDEEKPAQARIDQFATQTREMLSLLGSFESDEPRAMFRRDFMARATQTMEEENEQWRTRLVSVVLKLEEEPALERQFVQLRTSLPPLEAALAQLEHTHQHNPNKEVDQDALSMVQTDLAAFDYQVKELVASLRYVKTNERRLYIEEQCDQMLDNLVPMAKQLKELELAAVEQLWKNLEAEHKKDQMDFWALEQQWKALAKEENVETAEQVRKQVLAATRELRAQIKQSGYNKVDLRRMLNKPFLEQILERANKADGEEDRLGALFLQISKELSPLIDQNYAMEEQMGQKLKELQKPEGEQKA